MQALAAAAVAAVALLPAFAVSSVGPDGGQVLTGTIPGGQRPALVYLPPGYASGTTRFPVVYLLHGLRGSPSEYVSGADLLRFADTQIASGRMQPFIAVMPSAGADHSYDGEWAGYWERYVRAVVAWSDAHFRTIPSPAGRVIAGLSAGGFGAVDIALRNPGVFGRVESWSGYFTPLRDAPFTHAPAAVLRANDPTLLVASRAAALRRSHVSFFLSTGPSHSHHIPAAATIAFAHRLWRLGVRATLMTYPTRSGEWRAQVQRGLEWALATPQSVS